MATCRHLPALACPRARANLAQSLAEAFARHETLLRGRLERLESHLQHAPEPLRTQAGDHIAVIQVGLTCLSEAIDELAAELGDACPPNPRRHRA